MRGRQSRWEPASASSVKRGTSIEVVQDALGQASLKTTTISVSLAREEIDRQLQENAL